MKKPCCILIAAILLLSAGFCQADPSPAPLLPFELTDYGTPFELDLDGDGSPETVCWYKEASEPLFTVESAQGFAPASLNFGNEKKDRIWLADLDGDGVIEILRSGDFASDDEFTSCRHYHDGEFEVLAFPMELSDGTFGNGTVYAIDGNALTLDGYLHLIGSHYALRTYALVDGSRFEPIDDGIYRCTFAVEADELSFEDGAQTVLAEIPYEGIDGTRDGTLVPGDVILLTATDNVGRLWFKASDGRAGIIRVWRVDESNEFDWRIGDRKIEDVIDGIIYAG